MRTPIYPHCKEIGLHLWSMRDPSHHLVVCSDRPKGFILKYELTFKQGKVAELRAELTNPGKKDKNHSTKKNALKKIVANMTMSNNDMVALFPDIVACMEIPVLEIKKMYVERPVKELMLQLILL